MTISKGKYEVKIKASTADNIGIPKVSNTNYIMEAAEPILDVLEAFGQNAALNHSATFKADFNKKTTDAYLEFNKTHKNNPDQMLAATEAYNQSVIENTPLAYKEYVTAILAGKYLNAMNAATNNRVTLDNELAISNSIDDRKILKQIFQKTLIIFQKILYYKKKIKLIKLIIIQLQWLLINLIKMQVMIILIY